MGNSRLLFSLFLCFQYSWLKRKIADIWMQNADIWCWNQLLYELSHNHWPLDSFPLRLTATSAKLFRYITCLKIKFCQVCMFNFISAVGKFFTTICKIWHLKWLNGVWETINSIVLFLSLPLSIVLFLFLSLSIILFLSLPLSFYFFL